MTSACGAAAADAEAHRLAERAVSGFERHWTTERRSFENYNPFTGEGADTVDSQPFYSWTALFPLMWSLEQFGVTPWDGLFFGMLDGAGFFPEKPAVPRPPVRRRLRRQRDDAFLRRRGDLPLQHSRTLPALCPGRSPRVRYGHVQRRRHGFLPRHHAASRACKRRARLLLKARFPFPAARFAWSFITDKER